MSSKKKKSKTKKTLKKNLEISLDPINSEIETNAEKEQKNEVIDIEEYDADDSFGDTKNEIDEEADEDHEDTDKDHADKEEGEDGGDCMYNYADNSEEDEHEIVFDDDDEVETLSEIMPDDKRCTKPILFKYERVRLLCDRTQQLTLGAKPMVKNVGGLTAKEIAELEIELNVIPLIIQRPLPNGKKERWYIHELKH